MQSALGRFIARERPEEAASLEIYDKILAQQVPVGYQPIVWAWLRLAEVILRCAEHDGVELLDDFAADAADYWPVNTDGDGNPVADVFGAFIGSTWADIQSGALRLDALIDSLERAHRMFARSTNWGLLYDAAVGELVMLDAMQRAGGVSAAVAALAPASIEFQKLWWLSECHVRKGVVLAPSVAPALPADPDECVALLCRMAVNQPTLACWPVLSKQIPLRADAWMPLTERGEEAMRSLALPDAPELADLLAVQIRDERSYVLDHIAVVELDELSVRRIVMAPELRGDGQPENMGAACLIEHERGTFIAQTTIMTDAPDSERRRLGGGLVDGRQECVTFAPAVYAGHVQDAMGAVELLLLSAWRDLTVANVRDEQYEVEPQRKAKPKGKQHRGRQAIAVVGYLPRRVAALQAERQERAVSGGPAVRRLYPVGAFSKRLPAGQRRSPEAQQFAEEIGMPLADHQTVVKPHWRGGTEDERSAAADTGEVPVRTWRSWSALDLLRTRAAGPSR